MDYGQMAQRLAQFRQAQVPGGGQRPMNGWGQRTQGMFGPMAQGLFNRPVGQNPAAPGSHMNPQSPVPQMGGFNPRGLVRGGGM
jgi:hypothetical protein